ncbi:Uncharacterised protein r2_g3047 [Pycnogonum litorale]
MGITGSSSSSTKNRVNLNCFIHHRRSYKSGKSCVSDAGSSSVTTTGTPTTTNSVSPANKRRSTFSS